MYTFYEWLNEMNRRDFLRLGVGTMASLPLMAHAGELYKVNPQIDSNSNPNVIKAFLSNLTGKPNGKIIPLTDKEMPEWILRDIRPYLMEITPLDLIPAANKAEQLAKTIKDPKIADNFIFLAKTFRKNRQQYDLYKQGKTKSDYVDPDEKDHPSYQKQAIENEKINRDMEKRYGKLKSVEDLLDDKN